MTVISPTNIAQLTQRKKRPQPGSQAAPSSGAAMRGASVKRSNPRFGQQERGAMSDGVANVRRRANLPTATGGGSGFSGLMGGRVGQGLSRLRQGAGQIADRLRNPPGINPPSIPTNTPQVSQPLHSPGMPRDPHPGGPIGLPPGLDPKDSIPAQQGAVGQTPQISGGGQGFTTQDLGGGPQATTAQQPAGGGAPVTDPNALPGQVTQGNTLRNQRIGFDVRDVDPGNQEDLVRRMFEAQQPFMDQQFRDQAEGIAQRTSALGRTGSGMVDREFAELENQQQLQREGLLGGIAAQAAQQQIQNNMQAQGLNRQTDLSRIDHLRGERGHEDQLARQAMSDRANQLRFLSQGFGSNPQGALQQAAATNMAGAGQFGANAGMANQQLAGMFGAGAQQGGGQGGGFLGNMVSSIFGGPQSAPQFTPPIIPSQQLPHTDPVAMPQNDDFKNLL